MTFAPKSILVPVDVDALGDRSLADRLVDDACAMAKLAGARLILLHVAAPAGFPVQSPVDLVSDAYRAMVDVLAARSALATRVLQELVVRAENLQVNARPLLTSASGSVPEVIVRVAQDEGVDLIILTTHARRGLKRLVLGSVAESTAHLARIPVLLLPPA